MVAILLATIAAFVLWRGLPYAPAIAAFFVAFGATLVSMRGIVCHAVAEAFAARSAAQASEAALKVALVQVAAERDAKSRFVAVASHDLLLPIQAAQLYFVQLARLDQRWLRAEIELAGKAAFGAAQSLLTSMLDHLRLGAQAVVPRSRDIVLDDLMERSRPKPRCLPKAQSIFGSLPRRSTCMRTCTCWRARSAIWCKMRFVIRVATTC